ncbi:L,D-transpeptidase [Massilia sp. LjRoot122]|uniref:L,D-transpeptidase n=1 Tax=Massilia sp. LjRoot122 TaxID=3342257 RepID=UPI003ECC19C1
MPNIKLNLMLSTDRNMSGLLQVQQELDGRVLAIFEALGRGSKGGGDTQLIEKGNTPTGHYSVTRVVPTGSWNQTSYGPHGALRLEPASGNAKIAGDVIGRKGLLVHGGDLGKSNYWRGSGELRATHGCVRLSNDSMKQLIDLLFQATLDPSANMSRDIEVSLSITETPVSFVRPH